MDHGGLGNKDSPRLSIEHAKDLELVDPGQPYGNREASLPVDNRLSSIITSCCA